MKSIRKESSVKACPICGKYFVGKYTQICVACRREAGLTYKRNRQLGRSFVPRRCLTCGKIYVPANRKGPSRFCSKECYLRANSTRSNIKGAQDGYQRDYTVYIKYLRKMWRSEAFWKPFIALCRERTDIPASSLARELEVVVEEAMKATTNHRKLKQYGVDTLTFKEFRALKDRNKMPFMMSKSDPLGIADRVAKNSSRAYIKRAGD